MRLLGLKISCVLASVLIWIYVASTASIEQTVTLDVHFSGLADSLTIDGSELPKNVQVRIRDSKLSLLAHQYFGMDIGRVTVNLAGFPDTSLAYPLTRADIQPPTLDVNIVRSRFLNLRIDREISRLVPVVLSSEGSLPSQTGFITPPRIRPDSVRVTGPTRFFGEDLVLRTEPVDLGRVAASVDLSVKLKDPGKFLSMDLGKVQVSFLVGGLVDRTLANIPVIPLVDAGSPEVGISPPVADVMVRGVADSVRALTRDRVSVIVPIDNLEVGRFVLPGQVVYPDWLTLIRLDPPLFQVIVGDSPGLSGEPDAIGDVEDRDE